MSITPEVNAKTLTQLVATEIKVQMARADVRQSQLAREIGKTEQWLSVRLRGRQPIDMNDLALIAKGLKVGVHDLLPSPDEAASASVSVWNPSVTIRPAITREASRQRPPGRKDSRRPNGGTRTARLPRPGLPEAC